MLSRKKFVQSLILLLLCFLIILQINSGFANADTQYLYLGGFPAGFTLKTTTVEVIGICDVMTSEGLTSPAKKCGIKSGDIIEKINGIGINSAEDINKVLAEDFKSFNINIKRDNEELNFDIDPVKDMANGTKRLGILVKDTINGIGTVTYVDALNKKFASLGHPVTDLQNNLVEINGGSVYGCIVYDVKKGVKGTPGELKGAFESGKIIGKATKNCSCGIYGDLSDKFNFSKLTKIEKGSVDDAKIGKAYIYTSVYGNETKKYEISIVKTDKHNKDNRNYVIKVDDKELLEKSGGIVQGMSGSPIVQNGKIIGAVTHVFINDPARGYGISIDNMLNSY